MIKITFVVAQIIIKKDVITSYMAKIIFTMTEFICKKAGLWSLLPWPRSLL